MKLLIVDDDPKFRGYIQAGLEDSGVGCAAAADADEALAQVERETQGFDLILLDVMMPGRSGWEFLEELRRRGDATPVIFVTARDAVDERVRGLHMGADDYVIKPFAFQELLARVTAVHRRRQATSILEVADLRLDLGHRRAERAGQTIELTPREFELLTALVEARGRVLSRVELLRRIWGIDFDPGSNLVDVHVARLRRKLDRRGRPLVRTVVGEGYRIATAKELA